MISRVGQVRRRAVAVLGVFSLAAVGLTMWGSAPSGATTVNDETSFRNAWTNATETGIDLAADITLTCGGGGIAVRNSGTALTLDGHGHTITQTCAGNGVLSQSGAGALSFSNVTVTGGAAPTGAPGGIASNGDVTLNNSSVSGNTTAGMSGGTAAMGIAGSVTLNNSRISGNQDLGNGGGGGVFAGGNLALTNTTVNGNSCPSFCTAALSGNGTVLLTNSTVSNNTSSGGTAGIAQNTNNNAVTLVNSTVSDNTSSGPFANGGVRASLIVLVYSTVVANSGAQAANVGQNAFSPPTQLTSFGSVVGLSAGGPNCGFVNITTSNGFNFADDFTCGFTAATDRQGAGNPQLGPLANNGGPTQTRLPQPGSPLIDAIPTSSCQADGASGVTTDQRAVTRPQGPGCDIGSVEVQVSSGSVQTSCGLIGLSTSAGTLGGLAFVAPPPVPPPAGVTLPCGVISFQITGLSPGQTVTVTETLPPVPANAYYKFQNGVWFQLPSASVSGGTATFTLTDGGPGDNDGVADGTIVDPGGPAVVTAIVAAPRFTG